jgi:hypothetical protein
MLQAADATAAAINGGINRCQVEIHLPEFWGEQQLLGQASRQAAQQQSAATPQNTVCSRQAQSAAHHHSVPAQLTA